MPATSVFSPAGGQAARGCAFRFAPFECERLLKIVYSTHATSTDNLAGIASGHRDPDLAPQGISECAERRSRWTSRQFDLVVSSDLLRSRRTAALAFERRDITLRIDTRLRECDYGALNGAPRVEVDARRAGCIDTPFPGGESYEDVAARTRALLDDLIREHAQGTVLLVGHHAQRVVLPHVVNRVPLEIALARTMTGDEWQPEWTYTWP